MNPSLCPSADVCIACGSEPHFHQHPPLTFPLLHLYRLVRVCVRVRVRMRVCVPACACVSACVCACVCVCVCVCVCQNAFICTYVRECLTVYAPASYVRSLLCLLLNSYSDYSDYSDCSSCRDVKAEFQILLQHANGITTDRLAQMPCKAFLIARADVSHHHDVS